jgi:hypothetical protein
LDRLIAAALVIKYGAKFIYSIVAVAFFDNDKPFEILFNKFLDFNKNTFFA